MLSQRLIISYLASLKEILGRSQIRMAKNIFSIVGIYTAHKWSERGYDLVQEMLSMRESLLTLTKQVIIIQIQTDRKTEIKVQKLSKFSAVGMLWAYIYIRIF
jgi:hypothetical protein